MYIIRENSQQERDCDEKSGPPNNLVPDQLYMVNILVRPLQ